MPCCQCCCGGMTCAEGQRGKCCCGGPGGSCCQVGEYCCNGVCQGSPCGACTCPAVQHPTSIQWSATKHPYDLRPYYTSPGRDPLRDVYNGYSAGGTVTLTPILFDDGATWYFGHTENVTPVPNIVYPESKNILPTNLQLNVNYWRCYSTIGQAVLNIGTREGPDRNGNFDNSIGFNSRTPPENDPATGYYSKTLVIDEETGLTWATLPLAAYCGPICAAGEIRQVLAVSGGRFLPFFDFSVTLTGCNNPLP